MNVADFLIPEHIAVDFPATDKARLLVELARWAGAAFGVPHQTVHEALLAREGLGSTGVGGGVALPHARVAGLDRFHGMFARLGRPIAYEAVDDEPVDLIFLLLAPTQVGSEHLQALACIARRLHDPRTAMGLRGAKDSASLYRILIEGDGGKPAL